MLTNNDNSTIDWAAFTTALCTLSDARPTATFKTLKKHAVTAAKSMGLAPSPVGDRNAKTGAVGTYRQVGLSCPSTCPLLGAGCYAQKGRTTMAAKRASATLAGDLAAVAIGAVLAATLGAPLRLHVSGDVTLLDHNSDAIDPAYLAGVAAILTAVADWLGAPVPCWTYTHVEDAETVRAAWLGLVTVWHSDNDSVGGAIVVPSFAEHKRDKRHTYCPNQRTDGAIDCATCKLCFMPAGLDKRTIVFAIH